VNYLIITRNSASYGTVTTSTKRSYRRQQINSTSSHPHPPRHHHRLLHLSTSMSNPQSSFPPVGSKAADDRLNAYQADVDDNAFPALTPFITSASSSSLFSTPSSSSSSLPSSALNPFFPKDHNPFLAASSSVINFDDIDSVDLLSSSLNDKCNFNGVDSKGEKMDPAKHIQTLIEYVTEFLDKLEKTKRIDAELDFIIIMMMRALQEVQTLLMQAEELRKVGKPLEVTHSTTYNHTSIRRCICLFHRTLKLVRSVSSRSCMKQKLLS
jgi:hypothetical protein